MKTGLVLEGGGMRGLYTAGILDVFMEHNIHFDCVVGVSAGALFGINYLSGQKGRVLRYNKNYAKDKRYMGLHSLLTTGDIMNKKFCFDTLVNELDVFDYETYRNSETEFYATVTNVETGKAEYFRVDDVNAGMEYLRASGSLPLVSNMVEIDGKKYLDGGIADSIPFEKCRELGCGRIVLVLTRPLEYRKGRSSMLPAKLRYRKYPAFVDAMETRYLKYNESLETIIAEEQKNNIYVIRPSRTVDIKRLERDIGKIQEMYELGVKDGENCLTELCEYLK